MNAALAVHEQRTATRPRSNGAVPQRTRMTEHHPDIISAPEWDRELWWMIGASGGAHIVGIVLLLLIPHSFLHHPPAMVSYSVDLVAPDKVGGTNSIEGGKGRVEKAPMAAAPPVPKVEPPKPAPPPKVEEAKPAPKPEPPKVEPKPQEVAKPEPKPEPPKVEEKPRDEVALNVKKAEAPPPTVAAAPPTPQARAAPSPKVVAKAEPAKPAPAPSPKVDVKAAKEAAAAKQRDERIAAAVKRVEQQTGTRGGGTGSKPGEQPGGPISVGPGEGAGGAVRGVEYLLYRNQLENKIKQNWAWAGRERSLEAAVHFSITDSGEIVDIRITKSSGDASYDRSVERAVRAANPLAAPPAAYRKEFGDVEYTFTPESLQM